MRLTTRVRCRDCASSVRRVRKNQISCSNSSKLTVFSQIRWMKLQRRYDNTEEACCRRQSIHSLPHLVFCFFYSVAFSRSATWAQHRALLNAVLASKAAVCRFLYGYIVWVGKKMTVLFLYAILVLRLPLSHPFVGRWHRRFTGSGGGAINSRRRCLSWCLVIYSDRFINFWWL